QLHVVLRRGLEERELLRFQIAHSFGGASDIETPALELLALRHYAASTQDDIVFDAHVIQHHRPNTDQAEVADRTSVQHDAMAHGDVRTHDACASARCVLRAIVRHVKHAAILNARASTDVYLMYIPAQDGGRPDRGVFPDRHASNHGSRGIDVRSRSDLRSDAVESSDYHSSGRGLKALGRSEKSSGRLFVFRSRSVHPSRSLCQAADGSLQRPI